MPQSAIKTNLKVLVLDEEIPYPPDTGKRIRTWNLLRLLAEKHEVHFLCYGRQGDPSIAVLRSAGIVLHLVEPPVTRLGISLYLRLLVNLFSPYPFSVSKHYSRRYQNECTALLKQGDWDLIQCEWTPYARFISAAGKTPTLIATHNIESQIWKRRAQHGRNFVEKLFFGMQEVKMRWFERRALRRATAVTAVSVPDAETIRGWGIPEVTVVPNGVDLEWYSGISSLEAEMNEMISVASLDWFPNADAIDYFSHEIFPIIRDAVPDSALRIVGRRPSESLKAALSAVPGINFVGEVADVRPHLASASVVVVPLRIGGGSRLKILEALAAGKAVVSTSIGAEGLDLTPGKDLVIADSPQAFANAVVNLLQRRDARRQLGENGRKLVSEQYGWNKIARRLEAVWLEVVGRPHNPELVGAPARESHATS